jgi:ABC-2 type transport system ATP-binding protein
MSVASGPNVIEVQGLRKEFNGLVAVQGLDLQVRAGEIFGFLGPNGSGKTTAIRMLCGLLKPSAGHGRCLDFDILTHYGEIKRHVGYMTQRFSLYEDLSVGENLDFVARMYELRDMRGAVAETLEQLGLNQRRGQLVATLSGGWKQRLALAACLLHRPRLLLLDEPTAGVDPKARRDFWQEIHRLADQGISVLVSTHYMDEAERCHRLAYLAAGRLLAAGSVDEVIRYAGLTTWVVSGDNLMGLSDRLAGQPGVQQVTAFGRELHVSGTDRVALQETVNRYQDETHVWTEAAPGLEDVFVALMDRGEGAVTGEQA